MDDPIGKLAADVQQSLQTRVMEIDLEVYADEFQHWTTHSPARKKK